MKLFEMSLSKLHHELVSKKISAVELTKLFLRRIDAHQTMLNAFITCDKDYAMDLAKKADERLHTGKNVTPLTGIPIVIKDNISTKNLETTCASKILTGYVPPYDATVIEKLKDAGAVILGKTNMDEFAMGSSTENSSYGPTKNPWDITKVPGGSSGGSAAAVAALLAPVGLGSDTGGSVREPASFCGISGFKPTYSTISRYGLIAFASSLDQIGVLGRSALDVAYTHNVISGFDPHDSTSYSKTELVSIDRIIAKKDLTGMKIAMPKEYFDSNGVNHDVNAKVMEAIHVLKKLGATVTEVSLDLTDYAIAVYYVIATAEASSNLARFDGVRFGHRTKMDCKNIDEMYVRTRSEGFGEEVKRRIMLGTYVLSSGYYDAYFNRAAKVRTLICDQFKKIFSQYDFIVGPTAPCTAFAIGEKVRNPIELYLTDVYTTSVNLAGLPALSIPCGFDSNGLPIGLQIIGDRYQDEAVLSVGHAFQHDTDWHMRIPNGFENEVI